MMSNMATEERAKMNDSSRNWFGKFFKSDRRRDAGAAPEPTPRIDSRNAVVWTNKGLGLGNMGRFEEAIQCYDKALELDPRYATAWYNKGNNLNAMSRYEEAVFCYDKALELDPCDFRAWAS